MMLELQHVSFFNLDQLVILGILTSATHWLFARSAVLKPLWSRARGWLDQLLRCPSCSGFWLGLGFGLLGIDPIVSGLRFVDVYLTGMLAVFLTPVFEAVMLWGLSVSGLEEHQD